ncbi:N-6 DNA methylase [Microvirga aerilata]|uniref:site-specific DNA-methyltransferase (adenine-specific) n=2 Tax=Microvirga aerilata TaxID=670292 RepID=A0A936ZHB7_9HYPH|nr:type ISP restriction/modification enzyme [Microvirga aerilata]MBL0404694.1 N-6 DNA methylase [Microvirga aerilata]
MASPFAHYLKRIEHALKAGNGTEHACQPALKALIEALRPQLIATNEPQRIACGAPDFIITHDGIPLGYIETTNIGADLDEAENTPQLKRCLGSLHNVILTDHLEFRLYRDGERVGSARLARVQTSGDLRISANGAEQLILLLDAFFDARAPVIKTPRELAERMARLARLIDDLIRQTLGHESKPGDLHAQYDAVRKILIPSLSVDEFADMYAQTIAYGLFAARCNHVGSGFMRELAGKDLPKTNPFLRRLFNTIAGADLDERIAWAVDDLSGLLAKADMAAILEDFGHATQQTDPVVHFYESFLKAYDPKLRELRGVYYTPEPAVGYIVRSVDALLKREFKLADGIADSSKIRLKRRKANGKGEEACDSHRVQILDPACGTGTFLHAIIASIHEQFSGNPGFWPGYVAQHLLPRLHGFELLMAPYAIAHMKLGLQLKESGYDFATDERLRVFLTNTLEEAHEIAGLPLFTQWLAEEAAAARDVGKNAPIMVVVGNPPYSGHSANKGEWIEGLLESYKQSPELKKPAQAKWLSDDYVKFIRFAQWRIEQTGHGILAFITNHSYLDNPTFLDMRASLMSSFDDIYVLDLHGNGKKKEKTPGGGKDENIFDIQQGVSIALLVRRTKRASRCTVRRADLWGGRTGKYAWLADHDVLDTDWEDVTPSAAPWLFVKQDERLAVEYNQAWSVADIFKPNGEPAPGFATQHDEFAISFTCDEARRKVEQLLETRSEAEARELFSLCAQSQWSYDRARAQLPLVDLDEAAIEVLYRPFDTRFSVYDRNVLVHRRERVTAHLLRDNLALCIPKNQESSGSAHFDGVFCADRPVELNLFRRGGAFVLPLWLYQAEDLRNKGAAERTANLSPAYLTALKGAVGSMRLKPEDVFAYIYAVLYAPGYRARYADFLKRSFPRIPIPRSADAFKTVAALGHELIALHLMRETTPSITKFPKAGSNRVEKVEFVPDPKHPEIGQVAINDEQFFQGMPRSVWEFTVGGYPVAHKWLKDRKGRLLTFDELKAYGRIVGAIDETFRIQDRIDEALQDTLGIKARGARRVGAR